MSADCPSARTPSLPRSAAPRPNSTRGRRASIPTRRRRSSIPPLSRIIPVLPARAATLRRSLPWRATWSSMRSRAPSPASPTSWAATSGARATRRHKAASTPTRSRRTSHAAVPTWQSRMPSTRVRSTWCRSSSTTSTSGCTTSTSRPTTSPALCSASRRTCRPCRDKRVGKTRNRLPLHQHVPCFSSIARGSRGGAPLQPPNASF
mmetsp:Transcript_42570/g.134298  ORF Transcript_42570/g.134298 Transcript_42570/m.134298 type:complete len:206 (-) Transcript_42570:112-729(-)